MFLNALSAEDKPKFLAILYITAKADGAVTEEELLRIGAYANEMGIENAIDDSESFESIVGHFEHTSESIRKIVFAEILALTHADDEFHSAEKELVKTLKNRLSISNSLQDEIITWVAEISPLYARGFKLVDLV